MEEEEFSMVVRDLVRTRKALIQTTVEKMRFHGGIGVLNSRYGNDDDSSKSTTGTDRSGTFICR